MRFILAGTRLVFNTPRLWRYIIQPLLVGAAAFIVVTAGAYWLIVPRLNTKLDKMLHTDGIWAGAMGWITSGLYIGLLIFTSGFLYLTLVSFFSSSLWEKLSLEVELMTTGQRVETKLPISVIVGDGFLRGSFTIGIAIACLCCGWIFFGIPGILLAGYVGLHDYTSAAYMRRGITFPAQMAPVGKLPARFSFLVGAGLLTLLPVVNVIMLPCLVAAGTLMVVESDKIPESPSILRR
jgi:uncharacterized protein involved in cysteine biosynthesis